MRLFSVVFLFFAVATSSAQNLTNFTQFYVNPYSFNASYAGTEGKTGLYLAYRKQWANQDFEGAPVISNMSFHSAVYRNVNFGINFNNDKRGPLSTSAALMTWGYTLYFDDDSFLRFGLSAGAAYNGLNFDLIDNPSDPVWMNLASDGVIHNTFLQGNAGISLHLSSFHFGAAIPELFQPKLLDSLSFSALNFAPTDRFIFNISNRFYFGDDKYVFEPYLLYRYRKYLPGQFEAAGILHLNHVAWFGGSYKQNYGISANIGFKLPTTFGVGYSYTFVNFGDNQINTPTHEVVLTLLLGKDKEEKLDQRYSFNNTIKKKKKKIVKDDTPPPPPDKIPEKIVQIDTVTVYDTLAVEPEDTETEFVESDTRPDETETEVVETPPVMREYASAEHVVVKRGNHLLEIPTGEYVVVGVFSKYDNAESFSDDLFMKGYQEARFGYISERDLWYVYIHKSNDPQLARTVRDTVRKIKIFSDAWALTVQE